MRIIRSNSASVSFGGRVSVFYADFFFAIDVISELSYLTLFALIFAHRAR
jgi:hypothetical protein